MIETPIQPVFSMDVLYLLVGALLVLLMHAGFALREAGTVRARNQVNAFVKILAGLAVAAPAYLLVGQALAYGEHGFSGAAVLAGRSGHEPMKFVLLVTVAALVPAMVSGAIAERARLAPQLLATAVIVALAYPFLEGIVWGERFHVQALIESGFGAPFRDFGGSVVVHAMGGWIALGAVLLLGPRRGRYGSDGALVPIPPSNVPFVALGSWLLVIGWIGLHVVHAQGLDQINGLVAANSIMALSGGVLAGLLAGRSDPGFVHHGALAGLVAVGAGADVMHPLGAFLTGGLAALLFVVAYTVAQHRWKIDDVLGVWPLHGLGGAWGGIACGIFGSPALGGSGGVSLLAQIVGTLGAVAIALMAGLAVYGTLKAMIGIRLPEADEAAGADRSIHRLDADRGQDTTARS